MLPKLQNVFALFGIPDVVQNGKGRSFNGSKIKEFANHLGSKYKKITPIWPHANGEAERFIKTVGKSSTMIKAAHSEHRRWNQKLYDFLRIYSATSHSTTNATPAEVLLGRQLKTRV